MTRAAFLALAMALNACAVRAEIAFPPLQLPPDAEPTAHIQAALGEFRLPTGPWEAGTTPVLDLVGAIDRKAWRLPGRGMQTLTLAGDLRKALVEAGFEILFACAGDACGGFDFRFDLDLLDEPAMHVDLSDFRFLSAVRGEGQNAQHAGLTISRAGSAAYLELTVVAATGTLPPVSLPTQAHPATGPDESKPPEADARSLVERLKTDGHAVLVDVRFESGSADLSAGPTPSLDAIAGYLSANPAATILIVGHTDASGGLQSNLSLSRMRAQAVVERLVRDMAADPERIMAEGAGPLAPIATNLTEEGRQKNRRVEAVLTSTR